MAPYTILYVDDEPDLLFLGKQFLESIGDYDVDTRLSAQEGLAILRTKPFDAVISDYHMPVMDGLVFLKEVRTAFGNLPFILFTGRGREEVVIEAINNGVDFYLQKGGDVRAQFAELAHKINMAVERNRAEETLQEREVQLRSIADNLPNGMVYQLVMEQDGTRHFTHVSAGVEQVHEVGRDAVLRDPMVLYNQIHTDDRIRLRETEDRALATMSPFSFEARICTPSGKERWLLLRSAPRLSGPRTVWDGIELDITASRLAEEELKGAYEQLAASEETLRVQFDQLRESQVQLAENEEKYRILVSHTDDGVFIARDGFLLFTNEPFAAMCGYTAKELAGKPFTPLVAPEDREMVLTRHRNRLSGDTLPETYEFALLHRDGTTRVLVRIRVGTGTYKGKPVTIGTIRDITEERQRETALVESERRYRTILDNLQDAYIRADLNGCIIMASPSAARMFGYGSVDEMLGMSAVTLYGNPKSRAEIHEMLRKNGRVVDYIGEGLHRDGTAFSVSLNVQYYHDENGRILGTEGMVRDITDRKQVEDAFRQSEELHRSLFTASPDGIAMVDTQGRLTYVSPKALELFGLSRPEEAVGTHVLDWIIEEDRRLAGQRIIQVLSDTAFVSHTYRVRRRDGTLFVVEMHSSALHNSDGSVRGIISILRDITERKRAEEDLHKSEENYRLIIENMQDVFYRINRQGIITMISPFGARLVGYDSPSEIIGKVPAVDFYPDPKERDAFTAYLAEKKVVTGYPLTLRDRHGTLHHATASSRLLVDNEGNYDGIEGILHDVTHLKEVENALRQANRQITLMTSITRHDIHNQLLALRGWLELSRASVTDPDRMLELITKEQKIADVIYQQISFTTILDDMGMKAATWQDPVPLIIKSKAALPFRNIRLEIDVSGIEMFADMLFEKVFYNLFDNSLRYGGESMTAIRVSAEQDAEGLLLVVEDDGVGIAVNEKDRLFDRGFGKNTGLGLFLVREILAITGISIQETGVPGRSARFEMSAPAGSFRFSDAKSREN
jgi:PAS domain S-box-containing protein